MFAPFRALAEPIADLVRPMPYPEIYGPEEPDYRPIAFARTGFADGVDRQLAETILERIQASTALMAVTQIRVLGGAMARVPSDATAFAHRDKRIMVNVAVLCRAQTSCPSTRPGWPACWRRSRQGDAGAYVGFLGDEGEDRIRAAYPEATWDRLAAGQGAVRPATTSSGSTRTSRRRSGIESAYGATNNRHGRPGRLRRRTAPRRRPRLRRVAHASSTPAIDRQARADRPLHRRRRRDRGARASRASTGSRSRVRGGGHSVAGHAVVDGGLMIDLRPMNRVRVDPERRTAWCGGGANWGELDRETQAFGLAVTGGPAADTGVGGLTLGGGSGWLERKYGFTVDSLLSAEVVTADGRLLVASADRNPDLFWALKGGGGNFGVVTGFEFQLHEVGPLVYGGMMLFPIDAAVDLLKAYRGFMEDAPDEICGGAAILCAPPEEFVPEEVRGKPVLAVIACYVGPARGGRARLRPAARVGPGARDARADAVRGGAGPDRPGQPARPPPLLEGRASSASSRTRRSRPSCAARVRRRSRRSPRA